MEEYASALHYEQHAKSLGKSVESSQEKSFKSSKRNALSPNGTVSFNRHRSVRLSKTSDPLCRDASEQVHANSLNEIHYLTVNDSNDAAASGYNDVFGGPPKYSFPKSNSQPSIPMTMYDEIFRLPPKVLSSSRLSNLPVFDPPSYDNAGVYGIAPDIRESAAALRYEDIFGGGLPTGPTHVGVNDLFERFETRSTPSSRSASRLQSPFKAAGCFLRDADNKESPQNESFRRYRTPLRLQSFNSFLREKDEKMQQPADIKSEHKGSHSSRLSSTRSWNDANVHFRPESTREKPPNRITQNGVIQRDVKGKFPQQSFEAPDAVFTQMPNSTPDKETSSDTQNNNLPILKVSRTSSSCKDGLEANGGGVQRSKLKESTNQKHFAKLRTVLLSPQADENKHYREDIMKSTKARLNELQETWFTVDELKLKTNPTASPPPARLPPTLHPRPGSVAARVSGLRMANRVSEAHCNDQTGSFAGEDQHASSCELDCAFRHPYISASTSVIHLQKNQDNASPNIFPDTKEHAKLAEVARENEDEYASVDTSISSFGEEPINIFNVVSPDKVASGNMQQAEEKLIGLAGTFKQRETQQLWRDIGETQEAKEQTGKAGQETTNWREKSREALAKENHRDQKRGTDGKLSEWERATVKMQTKRPESAEEVSQAKEAKDFLKVTETKAAAEMLSRDDNNEGKKGTYWMEKANRIQELEQRAAVVALEKREREVREERERERVRKERELERQREREKDRMDLERAAKERAAVEEAQAKLERLASDARERAERPAAELKVHATSNRADRAAVERVAAEARARAEAKRVAKERTQAEAHGNNTRRTTVERTASDVSGKGEPATAGNLAFGGGHSKRNTNVRASSAQRHRHGMPDFVLKKEFTNGDIMTGVSSGSNNVTCVITTNNSTSKFPEVEGETAERRHARLERHERTLERAAKALSEKNQRDLEVQQEQAERHRVAGMLDAEIRRWSAGKQGNLRALLSTLQFILWRESGWQPFSLTDLISPAAVKKAYRKATLCVHPDKVQQKGASVQQKYTAEKVFDLLKEAWNKFNLEEQC